MPSNDDTKQQTEEVTKDRASGRAPVAAVLEDDYVAGVDDSRAHQASAAETSNDNVGTAPRSSDLGVPQEFTFFQKKKRSDQAVLAPSVVYASKAHVTAFAARLDSAMAVNAKTRRHIAELMILMSDVARTIAEDASSSTRKRFCWSKWLFYGCLVGSGVGWFSLSPSGHDLLTQLAVFLLG